MKIIGKLILTIFLAVAVTACKDKAATHDKGSENAKENSETTQKTGQAFIEDDESTPNVLNIAMNSKDHTTLVKAVQTAGIENSLVNAGPLTVFAPTNAAFEKLPEGTLENLMKHENRAKLGYILKHHVTPGNYNKEFLKKFKKLGQASGQNVKVTVKGDKVFIDGAKIIKSIPAGNGIVHVVDKVLVPEE